MATVSAGKKRKSQGEEAVLKVNMWFVCSTIVFYLKGRIVGGLGSPDDDRIELATGRDSFREVW